MIKMSYTGQKNEGFLKSIFRASRFIRKAAKFKLVVRHESAEYIFFPTVKKEFWRYLSYFTKEEGTISWLKNSLQPNDVFFDIGANLGLYSLYAAKLGRGVKTYSFEPHKFNFITLIENIHANNLQNDVFPISIPLGNSNEVIRFNYQSLDSGAAMGQLGHKKLPDQKDFVPKFEEIVSAMTLDKLVESKAIPMPNAIKIDVDGNELMILEGMQQTLSSPAKPRTVQVEANPMQKDELAGFMAKFGYKLDHFHFTSGGQKMADKGVDLNQIAHNLVFTIS